MIETIPALLREAGKKFGQKTALVSPSESPMSFAVLDAKADEFAKALVGDGFEPGERVGVWAPNSWEWVAATVGAQRVGGVMVPLNSRYRASEVADIVDRAKVKYLVSAGDFEGLYHPGILREQAMPSLKRVIVLRADPAKLAGREEAWQAFLSRAGGATEEAKRRREAVVTGDTISDIMFTSGTTGSPKGAVFIHRSAARAALVMQNFMTMTDRDCFCPMGTFAHVGGYKQGWLAGLLTGATVCWGDAHDVESVLKLITSIGITVMPAPPIIWQGVLDYPDRDRTWDLSKLRFASTGGTMVPADLVRRLITELTVFEQVATGYGLTETCGIDNHTRADDLPEQIANTVGRPTPDTEIRIIGADGATRGSNEPGEILIRNGRLMIEYLDNPAATAATLDSEGWFHSGDVGSVDADGRLTITDRIKDMYITNGYNIYPAELEKLMSAMPGIEQCAIIGVPDKKAGEAGRAFIVRAAGSTMTEAEVIAWCRQNFAGYKVPRQIVFMDNLPRNVMGKVLKQDLRNLG